VNFKIIQGDSAEILKSVEQESCVDAIYFDPPFNTGRKFTLNPDNDLGFGDKFDTDGDYESLIDPVVSECARLLKKNGSLFFHISAEEMLIPHKVCSKYFSRIQPIFWQRSRSKNNVKKKLGSVVDVIFWCSKSRTPKYNLIYQPLDEYYAQNSYKNKDERGFYALGHIVYGKTQKAKDETRYYKIEIDGRTFDAPCGWRVSKKELDILLEENKIHVPQKKGNLYRKIYKHESKGKPATNLWDDVHSIAMGSEERKYPTQKPLSLLERIISMSTDPGDLILDPMAGSGTTGEAALRLDRKVILIDKNPDAIKIMKEKLDKSSD